MTLDTSWQLIKCDGENCCASTLPPVGLGTSLSNSETGDYRASHWVFIVGQGKELHFCPACAPHYLAALHREAGPADWATSRKERS